MAYPFAPMPSLVGFIKIAVDSFNADLQENHLLLRGPDGESKPRLLVRDVDGTRRHVILPYYSDEEILTPHIVRNLCKRLDIPLRVFGFSLEETGFEEVSEKETH